MNIITNNPLYFDELIKELNGSILNMQIITHDDMDGYSSAAVVFNAFNSYGIITKESCSISHYNYSDKIPTIDRSADIIFITDYSITNKAFMDDLLDAYKSNKYKIYWCDHHQTSIDNCKGKYECLKDIPGIRSTDFCGAALAWFYLNPGTSIKNLPYYLTLIDDFDCWKKKIPESDYLNEAFNYYHELRKEFHDSKSSLWAKLINSKYNKYNSVILDYGKTFYLNSKDRDYANIRRNGFIGVLDKFPKIKMLCLCNDSKGSQLFSDLFKSKDYPNGKYEYACAFQYDGTKFVVSIYTPDNANPNAQKICKAYGGGGHPGAAGFQTKSFFVEKVEDIPEGI